MQPHIEAAGFTGSLSKAGLAEGTTAATIKTAAPNGAGVDFAIKGRAYHKADTDNIALTAAAQQPVSTVCAYLIQIDSAGAVSSKKGEEVSASDFSEGRSAVHWPSADKDRAALGAVVVETDGSTTFTAGTTDLGAAGITDTYVDFAGGIPALPYTG